MTQNTINVYELEEIIETIQDEINTRLHNKAFQDDSYIVDYIKIYAYKLSEKKVDLKVNWSSIGATTPEKAQAYAEALAEAAAYCRISDLNGKTVTFERNA